jgi:hypothetical protein
MSLRLSALALLAAATFAGTSAHAGGVPLNLNVRITGAADAAIVTARHPMTGYGPIYSPPVSYGGPGTDHRRPTKFDPNTQFDGLTDGNSAGATTLKPPKLPK